MKKWAALLLAGVLFSVGCTGERGREPSTSGVLDRNDPVMIEIWTYYNSRSQEVLDRYIKKFNETEGVEKGIIVSQAAYGSIDALTDALRSASTDAGGSSGMPDLFITYKGIASTLPNKSELVDFHRHLTKEEIDAYVDVFVKTGSMPEEPSEFRMFSIDKASEVLMINQTAFDVYRDLGIIDYDDLTTYESMAEAARRYYVFTDEQTETPHDGKALYGANSLINVVWVSMAEMGHPITRYEDGMEKFDIDKASFRRIFDYILLPYIRGHYDNVAKFITDDIRSGQVLVGQSSTSSTPFFPAEVLQSNGKMTEVEGRVMGTPGFEGTDQYFLIQGGGVFAYERNEKTIAASVEFLKWITNEENALDFAISKSYLPALEKMFRSEKIDLAYREKKIDRLTAEMFLLLLKLFEERMPYEPSATANYETIRKELSDYIGTSWKNGRAEYFKMLEERGEEETLRHFTSDAYFEHWYAGIQNILTRVRMK